MCSILSNHKYTNFCGWYLFDAFSDDFSRVKLNKIKGEEGSDYINASFLDVRLYSHCYYYEHSAGRVLVCKLILILDLFTSGI